jgi:hypothetical protein
VRADYEPKQSWKQLRVYKYRGGKLVREFLRNVKRESWRGKMRGNVCPGNVKRMCTYAVVCKAGRKRGKQLEACDK